MNPKINVPFPMITCSKLLWETFCRFFHNGANKSHFTELYRPNKHEQGIHFCLCCIIMLILGQGDSVSDSWKYNYRRDHLTVGFAPS